MSSLPECFNISRSLDATSRQEVKEMHWAGVKSEKYLQFSDSHPGTATTDRSSTGYSGAEMAINDLQDILRASNELRHEREKFVGSRNRKLYELDEAAQVSEDAAHTLLGNQLVRKRLTLELLLALHRKRKI